MPVKHGAIRRLFLAFWPAKSEQQRFHALAQLHRPTDNRRPLAVHKLHMTLSFLGSVDAETERCVCGMAESLVWQPIEMQFNRLGWFAHPKVLWAGCSDVPPELKDLAATIQAGVTRCGIESELRPFQPHITLARKVAQAPVQTVVETLTCLFDELCLVQSRSGDNGVSYSTLKKWPARVTTI